MKSEVLISICIPAYKNTSFLKRLLDSVAIQTFTDYEVIITDDSPDDSVQRFVGAYTSIQNLSYIKNLNALGTPENWNEGMRRANGKWIKIMHDDDWFADPNSLRIYADRINFTDAEFIFSSYRNVYLDSNVSEVIRPSNWRFKTMKKEPYTLFAKNVIGPPSVTIHVNKPGFYYDNKTKWVVDIDFYIRWLNIGRIDHLDEPLINVGMSSEQVTVDCVNNRKIQVPENFHLLNKVGVGKLKNIIVHDAWWRLIRNLEITDEQQMRAAGYAGDIPDVIGSMISFQKTIPRKLLNRGVVSKFLMSMHFIANKKGS